MYLWFLIACQTARVRLNERCQLDCMARLCLMPSLVNSCDGMVEYLGWMFVNVLKVECAV